MEHLEFPDRHYLNCALGWLELGNHREARAEAARLSAKGRAHREAFVANWRIASQAESWKEAHRLAVIHTQIHPRHPSAWICLSYSLYRLHRPLEAWMQLLPKACEFPNNSAIPYLLACYASEMGNPKLRERFLDQSIALGGPSEVKGVAMEAIDVDALIADPPSPGRSIPPRKRLRPS